MRFNFDFNPCCCCSLREGIRHLGTTYIIFSVCSFLIFLIFLPLEEVVAPFGFDTITVVVYLVLSLCYLALNIILLFVRKKLWVLPLMAYIIATAIFDLCWMGIGFYSYFSYMPPIYVPRTEITGFDRVPTTRVDKDPLENYKILSLVLGTLIWAFLLTYRSVAVLTFMMQVKKNSGGRLGLIGTKQQLHGVAGTQTQMQMQMRQVPPGSVQGQSPSQVQAQPSPNVAAAQEAGENVTDAKQ